MDQALRQFGDRLFEAAPGLTTWILLLAPAWIPIIFPWPGAFVVAGGVLLFDVYWLGRSMTVVTGRRWARTRPPSEISWSGVA